MTTLIMLLVLLALVSLGLLSTRRRARLRPARRSRTSAWYSAREAGWQKRDRRHEHETRLAARH